MDIVFLGSGPVAAASLESLTKHFSIEVVITKASPAHHKGAVPVEELANKLGLPILFANSRMELDELISQNTFRSKIGIIVDYGVIVSEIVIQSFPLGIINSHFSLLPEWRGADPISFSILSGQSETGVSLMSIVTGLDEGPLLSQEKIRIDAEMTTPELTKALVELSNRMLIRDIPLYADGKITLRDQPNNPVSYSRKLTKKDGIIDWNKPAEVIEREIRAYIDWPKSRTTIAGKDCIITRAYCVPSTSIGSKPGDVEIEKELGAFSITTGNGSLWVQNLKPAGKNEMTAAAFIAGYGRHLS